MEKNRLRAYRALAFTGLLTAAICATTAWAAASVSSQLEVRQVTQASGHEVLKPAQQARPGDLLEYSATYSNQGDAAAVHFLANVPVPVGTTLKPDGIIPPGAQATLDGSHFAAMPLTRSVVGKDGKPHQEPVPMSEIRGLRWDLGTLAPHQARTVQLRALVNAVAASQPAGNKPPSSTPQ